MIVRFLWPAALWSIVVLVSTLIPGKNLPDVGFFQVDKLVHIFIFGTLMFLTSNGLRQVSTAKGRPVASRQAATIYCFLLGIGIEVIQQFVPGRSFSLADVVANCIGIGLGLIIFRAYRKRRKADPISRSDRRNQF